MKKKQTYTWAICLTLITIGVGYLALHLKATTPDIGPPSNATNVYFSKRSGWQTMRYFYRFDATEDVCIKFGRKLMEEQGFGHSVEVLESTNFPVKTSSPDWFDPYLMGNGTLLIGDDRAYAFVVSGVAGARLYYYLGY